MIKKNKKQKTRNPRRYLKVLGLKFKYLMAFAGFDIQPISWFIQHQYNRGVGVFTVFSKLIAIVLVVISAYPTKSRLHIPLYFLRIITKNIKTI